MKPKTWIETDHNGIQWRVQRVTGVIARILTGRNSYLAYRRLTPLPPDACGGQTVDDEKRAAAGAAAAQLGR